MFTQYSGLDLEAWKALTIKAFVVIEVGKVSKRTQHNYHMKVRSANDNNTIISQVHSDSILAKDKVSLMGEVTTKLFPSAITVHNMISSLKQLFSLKV